MASVGNYNENPCPGCLQSDVATIERGRLSFVGGVVAQENDLVIDVTFIFCNGSTIFAFVLYCALQLIRMVMCIAMM